MFQRLCDYLSFHNDDIIAFISGDLMVSLIVLQLHPEDMLIKTAGVFTLGVVGGFAGLLGKKLFILTEEWLKKKFTK
tara:strand:- start:3352 stop:3582 length:231 start_codon:yes stop_codon:yes gene_type:complete